MLLFAYAYDFVFFLKIWNNFNTYDFEISLFYPMQKAQPHNNWLKSHNAKYKMENAALNESKNKIFCFTDRK